MKNPNRVYNGSLFIRLLDRLLHPTVNVAFYLLAFLVLITAISKSIEWTNDITKLLKSIILIIAWFFWVGVGVIKLFAIIIRLISYIKVKYFPPSLSIECNKCLTIIQPLCGNEDGTLKDSLLTVVNAVITSSYKSIEIIYSIESRIDTAYMIALEIQNEYKNKVDINIVMAGPPKGGNAKLNNTYTAYNESKYDWILFIDSNINLDINYLRFVAPHMNDLTSSLATTTIIAFKAESFWGYVFQGYMNSFFANGLIWSIHLMAKKGWWGKCGLLRKSALNKIGGLMEFRNCFNEDSAIGWVMQEHGYPLQMMDCAPKERVGNVTFHIIFERFVRWGIIRRCTAPLAFVLEPITTPLLWSLLGYYLYNSYNIFFMCMLYTYILDILSCGDIYYAMKIIPFTSHWIVKELIYYLAWFKIWITNTVKWRGQEFCIDSKCMLVCVTPEKTN